jgi:hypothetical protein
MEGGDQMGISSGCVGTQTAHVVRDIVGATPADLQRTLHSLHHIELMPVPYLEEYADVCHHEVWG